MLDKVDGLIADAVFDGEELNAADFQIATSVRLLMCFDELRPAIQRRPTGAFVMRICPEFPGRIGPVLESAEEQPIKPDLIRRHCQIDAGRRLCARAPLRLGRVGSCSRCRFAGCP
jgi:hypothetical protein